MRGEGERERGGGGKGREREGGREREKEGGTEGGGEKEVSEGVGGTVYLFRCASQEFHLSCYQMGLTTIGWRKEGKGTTCAVQTDGWTDGETNG